MLLYEEHCAPIAKDIPPINAAAAAALVTEIPAWTLRGATP